MKKDNAIVRLTEGYAQKPLTRSLITASLGGVALLNPGAGITLSAIDALLVGKIQKMRENRIRTYFDEISKGENQLTEEVIQDDDFLHAHFITLKDAANTRQEEKIRRFARLLINSTRNKFYKTDEFEEFVAILDDLSMREFSILLIMRAYQNEAPIIPAKEDKNKENDLARANSFWKAFENKVFDDLSITSKELRDILHKINRTGLYETIVGSYFGYTGGRGRLTPLYYKFISKLMEEYTPEKPKA